ncbi:penicillin-binding protein activator [Amaricoccus tamworthensis]|uniref:penicillin-binding protein activator n=1 Tax=Amaricoccus tamworthensis TaxID=57002 RepID=UPI003C7A086F
MLSKNFSRRNAIRSIAVAAAMGVLSACAPTPGQQSSGFGGDFDPNQPVKVALLVPSESGDPGRELIARSLINAANLAVSDLRNADIDLTVYPTYGTSGGGSAAASQAVAEGAKIIVGPLFSTATSGAEPVAAGAGLKLLSMSNNIEVASNNVYILGNTFANTADSLVAYAMSRGLRNFGVVYPEGLEGETARNAASSAIQRRGATLVASEPYSLSVEGINSSAPSIASSLNSNGANAVILTDGPTGGLGYIGDALRDNGVDHAQVQYLGMQRWDVSAETLALPSMQGGAFAAPDPGLLGAFQARYTSTFGESPHEVAGLAYDGIAAVGALISEARSSGVAAFSDAAITQPSGFAGVGGAFRFLPDGTSQRNLAIYEVQGAQAVVVQRAAGGFGTFAN